MSQNETALKKISQKYLKNVSLKKVFSKKFLFIKQFIKKNLLESLLKSIVFFILIINKKYFYE